MSTQSCGAQLGAFAQNDAEAGPLHPNAMVWEFAARRAAIETVKGCLDAVTNFVTAEDDPRAGVVSYAFTRACPDDQTEQSQEGESELLHFFEVFADQEAAAMHIASNNEGEAFAQMFEDPQVVGGHRTLFLNGDASSKCTTGGAYAHPLRGHILDPKALQNKWLKRYGDRMRPQAQHLLLLELWLEPAVVPNSTPKQAEEARSKLLSALGPLMKQIDAGARVCGMVYDAWQQRAVWVRPRDPNDELAPVREPSSHGFSEHAVVLHILDSTPETLCNHFFTNRNVQALIEASSRQRLVYTAADWSLTEHKEAVSYFDEHGLRVHERRELFSGFLLHPMYCRGWEGVRLGEDVEGKKKEAAKREEKAKEEDVSAAAIKAQKAAENCYFELRHHRITGALEAVVFHREAAEQVPTVQQSGVVSVAVMNVANRLCHVGRRDREIAAGTLFGQLARLRRLVEDVRAYNW
jgi:hypothetical protein